MATGFQSQAQRVPENLKKQLALAVRSTQWSYAIFWFISDKQPGVLEWSDGYYNGDIKTRKTVQSIELNADQLSLQRSEQLRDLYESLSAGESSPQIRRPAAALSPEDLTDTEWYYLVCMSFMFNIGQGLPGRTLATGRPIWLCNAHYADSKVFSRSLLAKTVICFPYLGGVIEIGVTEPVVEDLSFIQHIKSSFLEVPNPIVSSKPNPITLDHQTEDTKFIPVLGCEQLQIISPNNSSNGFPDRPADGLFMANDINRRPSQVQSWKLLDDEFSNCVHHSLNSSDCISETFIEDEKIMTDHMNEEPNNNCLQDNSTKLSSLDNRSNDLHYQSVLSSLLKTSHQLMLGPHFRNSNKKSSFNNWKKDGRVISRNGNEQKLLKKILFEVPQMHDRMCSDSPADTDLKGGVWKPEADEIGPNHVISGNKRDKVNERFYTLKSMIPSIKKVDQVSILDDTIEYVQELERRVQELETCQDPKELGVSTKRKLQDTVERTSDNYGNETNKRKQTVNKRKACDIDRTEMAGINYVSSTDNTCDDISVSINDMDVAIEIKCPWREGILLEVMDAASNLRLDCHTVQSSNCDGILSVTIKSKQRGSTVPSSLGIKQALRRVAWKI
ncbi:hypothetical protein ACFE04_014545 [Oxalis oulophora]